MDSLLSAYKAVGDCRYREISGLYWEDFTPEIFLSTGPDVPF